MRGEECDYGVVNRVIGNMRNAGIRSDFTEENRDILRAKFLELEAVRTHMGGPFTVVEIGVENNVAGETSTSVFLNYKHDSTFYLGIDILDRKALDNSAKNIYTLQQDSADVDRAMVFLNSKGIRVIDFLFIDGWHSLEQVTLEWSYTQFLHPRGIVGFHDTNHHYGPKKFLEEVIDRSVWKVEEYPFNPDVNFGIAFATRN